MNKKIARLLICAGIWIAAGNSFAASTCAAPENDMAPDDCILKDPGKKDFRTDSVNQAETSALMESRLAAPLSEGASRKNTQKKSSQKSAEAPAIPHVTALPDFVYFAPVSRNTGKWYFEVSLNPAEIAKLQKAVGSSWPTNIGIGCAIPESDYNFGSYNHLSLEDKSVSAIVGLAVDFDLGKAYVHQNGHWRGGPPGDENGKKIVRGEFYACGIELSIALQPLLKSKLVQINFGEEAFKYSPPENFKAFHKGFFWVQGGVIQEGKTTVRRLYFDYRQLQEAPAASPAFIKEEFLIPQDAGEGLAKYTSRIVQADIDCNTEQMTQQGLTLYISGDTFAGVRHSPLEMEHHPGPDTIGGRFVRSVCFLRKHRIALPPPETQDNWEEMQSPAPSVRITEAVAQRQLQNGLLFIKQMNETALPVEIAGKASQKLVAISALDCRDMTSNQIAAIRYDNLGFPIWMDFFMEANAIRLENNKRRFAEACVSLGSTARTR